MDSIEKLKIINIEAIYINLENKSNTRISQRKYFFSIFAAFFEKFIL